MNALSTKLAALTHWLLHSRHHAPRLEDEAEAILAQLSRLMGCAQRIEALAHQPLAIGIYGHALASKKALLKTLLNRADATLWLRCGERKLDYFTHVHPAWHQSDIAVRFTAHTLPVTQHAPLLLSLYREGEFAQRLAEQAHVHLLPEEMCSRLEAVRPQAMRQPLPGMSTVEAMDMLIACQRHAPAPLSAALLMEMADLLPRLRQDDRAQLLAPLWGNDARLTAAWRRHAGLLAQLGNVTQVLAGESLLLSETMCRFAAQADETADPQQIAIFPLCHDQPLAAQSVRVADLAHACAELTLQHDEPDGCPADIIQIPARCLSDYARRLLPDALLVCQPADTADAAHAVAQQLTAWLSLTETVPATPRLVWALTAEDRRGAAQRQSDESVQRVLMRTEIAWGVLQLADGDALQQTRAWLKETVNQTNRHQRYRALLETCEQDTEALFAPFLPPTAAQRAARAQQIKHLVQHLQQHIDRHGDLLTALDLPPGLLAQTYALFRQKSPLSQKVSVPVIDLFAEPLEAVNPIGDKQPDLASAIYRAWIAHLRQLTPAHPRLKRLSLSSSRLQLMVDLLIKRSVQRDLCARLRERLAAGAGCDEAQIACAAVTVNEFVTWLGYADTPAERRPRSKVVLSDAIFTASAACARHADRLTQLEPQPLSQGLRWAYDWLVALYSLTQETDSDTDTLRAERYLPAQATLASKDADATPVNRG
ncbi:virulence factor SrfC family protein [Pantoea sp. KPR_PJ]|uniref:virulence factor SrfC family protein n=1 Tax=Pantoea sp. KPR_PJ TaxID=2738375 RepID=UPI00352931B9